MERIVTLAQTILGFGVLGCAGSFERGGSLVASIVMAGLFCAAIYVLQKIKARLASRRACRPVRIRVPDDERRYAA